ncbi:MAG: undecaprenyl/decaprenyl-phosphate alpha-N-acetylglucosaminyl 1-phosphate transferase [Phycisphaerales bacterium]|nr:undecaprenyl/decaprenyl-phosphate alpha-N-acetylglucosaminyl 1-phosphate transferase [Phycisphaerales bacterium]MCI0674853.1 undecaprenyl/decaprenyl-phosphate alpha-N-acetylglucosaminyl 1-phosphate transferase [Phycisphaerales bacterium]
MTRLLGQTDLDAGASAAAVSAIDLLNGYAHIFIAAFVVTLFATPVVQKLAETFGVVDRPDFNRKAHTQPVAYLGGLAVFAGLLVAIGVSYVTVGDLPSTYAPVPMAIVIGMVAITFTGLADDVWGWDPRLKIAGQLVAAAALAIENVGVKVAEGVLGSLFGGTQNLLWQLPTPWGDVTFDLVYWTGTALIAIFVLGGCNSANLIDGLDGLLSGVVGIVALGLLAICLLMVPNVPADALASDEGVLTGARIVLCLGVLGAVLGFLPYNFKPASIFLGDSGSLLLGYMCVVIILMLGEHGQTHLVFAGLIVFSVPIIDTTLAIIRRRLAGTAMSAADDQHLHHQIKRGLGGVRRAVLALYSLSFMFALVGVTLAALVIRTQLRVRVVYAITFVLFGFVGAIAVKAARRQQRLLAAASRQAMASTQSAPITVRTSASSAQEQPEQPLANRAPVA